MRKALICVLCIVFGAMLFAGCAGQNKAENVPVSETEPVPEVVQKKDPVNYYKFPNTLGMEAGEAVTAVKETGFENVKLASDDGRPVSNSRDFIVTRQNKTEGELVDSKSEIVLSCSLKRFDLYLEVDFHENILLDRYNVELYLDGELIDVLQHGKQYTKLIKADVGPHTITLKKEGDDSVSYRYDLDLQEDSTYSCNLNTHSDNLEITCVYYVPGVQYARIEMPDLTGMSLPDAIQTLEDLQFVNINYDTDEIWPIWIKGNWTVESQNIEPGLHIDKNEEIMLNCKRK